MTWNRHHSSRANIDLLLLICLDKTLVEGLMSIVGWPLQVVTQRDRIQKGQLLISRKLVLGAKTYLGGCSC